MNTLSTTMILSLVFNVNSSESSVELINLVQINIHNELNVINILFLKKNNYMNTMSATI